MTEADLYRFMAKSRLGVLGSISNEGKPQSALVGIAVTPRLEIVFDTVKRSRKYSNLTRQPHCSFAIGWAGEQTLQFEGEAEELQEPELSNYQQIYLQAWPDWLAHLKWPDLVYFVVQPKWIRYSHYDRNPPQINEFDFQ